MIHTDEDPGCLPVSSDVVRADTGQKVYTTTVPGLHDWRLADIAHSYPLRWYCTKCRRVEEADLS